MSCWCKTCKNEYEKLRRKHGLDKKDMTTPTARYYNGKQHAKRRNLDWTITKEQFIVFIKSPCTYCGEELPVNTGYCLDRINSNLGYIYENVTPCCFRCNQVKSNHLSYEEMKAVMKLVKEMRMIKSKVAWGCEPLVVPK